MYLLFVFLLYHYISELLLFLKKFIMQDNYQRNNPIWLYFSNFISYSRQNNLKLFALVRRVSEVKHQPLRFSSSVIMHYIVLNLTGEVWLKE